MHASSWKRSCITAGRMPRNALRVSVSNILQKAVLGTLILHSQQPCVSSPEQECTGEACLSAAVPGSPWRQHQQYSLTRHLEPGLLPVVTAWTPVGSLLAYTTMCKTAISPRDCSWFLSDLHLARGEPCPVTPLGLLPIHSKLREGGIGSLVVTPDLHLGEL